METAIQSKDFQSQSPTDTIQNQYTTAERIPTTEVFQKLIQKTDKFSSVKTSIKFMNEIFEKSTKDDSPFEDEIEPTVPSKSKNCFVLASFLQDFKGSCKILARFALLLQVSCKNCLSSQCFLSHKTYQILS